MQSIQKMFQIPIEGDLYLRLAMPTDAVELNKLVDNNREYLSKFLPWVKTNDLEKEEKFLADGLVKFGNGELFSYVIMKKREIIGTIDLHNIDPKNNSGEIGYWLVESFQHQGIMTRAVKSLSETSAAVLGLHRIIIRADIENLASQKVAENAGFLYEGIHHEDLKMEDRYCDSKVYYYLFKDQS